LALGFAIAATVGLAQVHAQATRTFVSGTGNDGNPCTVSKPSQTLQAALAQTAAGGEIFALNSANYRLRYHQQSHQHCQ
jgi:hypothetical protein